MRWAHASSAPGLARATSVTRAALSAQTACGGETKPDRQVGRRGLDDGNSEGVGENEVDDPNRSGRVVAGRRMRKRRGRSQALKAYRSARERHPYQSPTTQILRKASAEAETIKQVSNSHVSASSAFLPAHWACLMTSLKSMNVKIRLRCERSIL